MVSMGSVLLKGCFFIQPSSHREGMSGYDILIEGATFRRSAIAFSAAGRAGDRLLPPRRGAGLREYPHHFFQTLTRNLPAVQNAKLFDWLVYLYEIWKKIDGEAVHVSSLLAMGELLKTGCTCTTDHLYLYPRGVNADFAGLQFEAASRLGMRFSPTRGSHVAKPEGRRLPPDSVVQGRGHHPLRQRAGDPPVP